MVLSNVKDNSLIVAYVMDSLIIAYVMELEQRCAHGSARCMIKKGATMDLMLRLLVTFLWI